MERNHKFHRIRRKGAGCNLQRDKDLLGSTSGQDLLDKLSELHWVYFLSCNGIGKNSQHFVNYTQTLFARLSPHVLFVKSEQFGQERARQKLKKFHLHSRVKLLFSFLVAFDSCFEELIVTGGFIGGRINLSWSKQNYLLHILLVNFSKGQCQVEKRCEFIDITRDFLIISVW